MQAQVHGAGEGEVAACCLVRSVARHVFSCFYSKVHGNTPVNVTFDLLFLSRLPKALYELKTAL